MKREFNNMKNNELAVHVVGTANTGKSTIQLIISQALKEHGFNVELTSNDFDSEEELIQAHTQTQSERIEAVKEKINLITINEVQAVRNIIQNGKENVQVS